MASLEKLIVSELRIITKNPKIKKKDMLEWSTSEEVVRGNLQDGEIVITIPDLVVWVAIKKELDKRT